MSHKTPISTTAKEGTRTCPVCGKRAYSPSGIHPQCAMRQADVPRAKRPVPKPIQKTNQAKRSWDKKCPRCGGQVHVRCRTCGCGFSFAAENVA